MGNLKLEIEELTSSVACEDIAHSIGVVVVEWMSDSQDYGCDREAQASTGPELAKTSKKALASASVAANE